VGDWQPKLLNCWRELAAGYRDTSTKNCTISGENWQSAARSLAPKNAQFLRGTSSQLLELGNQNYAIPEGNFLLATESYYQEKLC